MQDHFDWRSLAVAAITAPIAQAVGKGVDDLFGVQGNAFNFGSRLTSNFVNGVIAQEVRIKVYHQGKMDYESIAADAFGNALGSAIMEKMKTPSGEQNLKDEQAAKQAVEKSRRPVPAVSDYQEPDYSLLPKGAHAKLPMIQDSPTPAAEESGAQTVRAGDYKGSLERIAREQLGADVSQHDINNYVGQLFELNGITDARKIQPDQQIILPDANTAAATKGLKQYGQDITKGNARKYSLPDGWNMRDASAANMAGDTAKLVAAQQANSPSARAWDGTNGVPQSADIPSDTPWDYMPIFGTGAKVGSVALGAVTKLFAEESGTVANIVKGGIRANKAAGDAWEAEVINNVLPKTQVNIQPQITIKSNGPSGLNVRLDAMGEDIEAGSTKLSDMKASQSAPFTPNQKIVYPELETYGGVVVGKGKAPYVGGTIVSPIVVDIIRKP